MSSGPGPLVGLEDELSTVGDLVESARHASGRLLLVTGEAGIGKTRLAGACASTATDAGYLLLQGECLGALGDASVDVPFGPLVAAVGSLRAAGVPAEVTTACKEWMSPSTAMVGGEADPSLQRCSAFVGLVQQVARWRPTVLVVEDVHWADRSSLMALELLSRRLAEHRLLVVVTARTDATAGNAESPAVQLLARQPEVIRMPLHRMSDEHIAAVVTSARPALAQPERQADLGDVVRLADGIPHTALELAATLEVGRVTSSATSMGAGYLARLRECPLDVREVVGAVAAAGASAAEDLVAALWLAQHREDDDEEARRRRLGQALRMAVDRHLLEATQDGYRFTHALNRDVGYHDLLPGTRRLFHREAAAFLAAHRLAAATSHLGRAGVAAQIAAHHAAAGDLQEAVVAGVSAARAAYRGGAYPEADEHYRRSFETWQALPTGPELLRRNRADLLVEAAEARFACGDLEGAVSLLDRSQVADPLEAATLAVARMWLESIDITADAQAAACEEALDLLDRCDPAPGGPSKDELVRLRGLRAQALSGLALAHSHRGDSAAGEAFLRDALRTAGDDAPSGLAHALLTEVALELSPDGETALAQLDRARTLGAEHGLFSVLRRESKLRPTVLISSGRSDEAATLLRGEIEAAMRAGGLSTYALQVMAVQTLEALTCLGRWDETRALADEILATTPDYPYRAYVTSFQLQIAVCRDGPSAAAHWATVAREGLAGPTVPEALRGPFEIDTAAHLAAAARLDGELDDARRAIDAVWPTIERVACDEYVGPTALIALLESCRQEVDARRRGEPADEARLARCERLLAGFVNRRTFDVLDRARFALAVAEAELARRPAVPADARAFEDLIEQVDATKDVFTLLLALCRAGETALEAGAREAAVQWLTRAWDLCTALGAQVMLGAVRHTVRAAGLEIGRPPPSASPSSSPLSPSPSPPSPSPSPSPDGGPSPAVSHDGRPVLTAREREVLGLLADGLTNRVVGRRLGITEKTASVHVSNLLAKLGVRSRGQAVAAARRLGLIQDSTT